MSHVLLKQDIGDLIRSPCVAVSYLHTKLLVVGGGLQTLRFLKICANEDDRVSGETEAGDHVNVFGRSGEVYTRAPPTS